MALSLALFGLSASAVSTIPVPIPEDMPLRLGLAVKETNSFVPLAVNHLGGILGVAYGFGGGFEGGFQIRGGANSDALFQSLTPPTWNLGGDVVLRYLGNVTDVFYLGLQGRVGYNYMFGSATFTAGSNVTAGVGIPFGFMFGDAFALYLMPELEFGNRAAADTSVFGSLVGLGGAIGGYLCLGGPKLFLEVKPKTRNLSDAWNTFGMDVMLGIAFET